VYKAQPGRQEWVTVIECISADGNKIPPYVIFKGKHLISSWLPKELPFGWTFTTNTSGWTNNFHGVHWIKHFNTLTASKLDSPEEYRLLLCDGHDSHVSAELVGYCIKHRIILILLPPHSSHLLQPLDVAVFSSLKKALSSRQSRLFRSGLRRINKIEWLEHFISAREEAIIPNNIFAGWRGAGLFPENMHRILHQLPDTLSRPLSTPAPTSSNTTMTPFFLSSSPPEPSTLHSTNKAFLTNLSSSTVQPDYKNHIRRLSGISERLQAEVTILQKELKEIKEIHNKRKERASGKRVVLKGKAVLTTEEILKKLQDVETVTKAKKRMEKKTRKRKQISSESELEELQSEENDETDSGDVEILECIEVAL